MPRTHNKSQTFVPACTKHGNVDCISCYYDVIERAAIIEVDAKLSRQQAEKLALRERK